MFFYELDVGQNGRMFKPKITEVYTQKLCTYSISNKGNWYLKQTDKKVSLLVFFFF